MALKSYFTITVAFSMYHWTNEVAAVNISDCVSNPTGKVSLDIDVVGVPGPEGPKGDQGGIGIQGVKGDSGEKGIKELEAIREIEGLLVFQVIQE